MIWYVLGPAAKNSHRVSELCSVSLVAWRVPESLFYLSKGKCFGTFGRHLSAKETSLVQTFETQMQSPAFIHETPKIFATLHPVEDTWPGSSGGVWEGAGTESVETRGDVTGRAPTNPVSACFNLGISGNAITAAEVCGATTLTIIQWESKAELRA